MDIACDSENKSIVLIIKTCCDYLMRIIKSVSLPVHLAAKVEKIPNFSAYIQAAIDTPDMDTAVKRIEALTRAIDYHKETLRLIQGLEQQCTRKEYIRKVFNLIDERHYLED